MIALIKLSNGTEIIGDIVGQDLKSLTIRDPLQINYRQRMDMAPPAVYLHRFVPFAFNTEHVLKYEQILSYSVPIPGLVNYYSATLNAIRNNVDKFVDEELTLAANSYAENEEEEIRRAMMEKAALKPVLN